MSTEREHIIDERIEREYAALRGIYSPILVASMTIRIMNSFAERVTYATGLLDGFQVAFRHPEILPVLVQATIDMVEKSGSDATVYDSHDYSADMGIIRDLADAYVRLLVRHGLLPDSAEVTP